MGRARQASGGLIAAGLAMACLGPPAPAAAAPAKFRVGAANVSYTPPAAGQLATDPADCAAAPSFDGPRAFAFEEPYVDQQSSGHYDPGDPYLDCNENGRWDGNYLGGGGDSPRYYTHVADPVGARAMAVSNGRRTIAIEVLDNEGAFNVYADRIRAKVAADGYHLDGIYISSTHDESAPDTIGISGPSDPVLDTVPISSVNEYFANYMVDRAAHAIEDAYDSRRTATIDFSQAHEPANLRQCWSSYPFVDDQLMPSLRAVDAKGRTIVTLANVSQHAESLGFNPDKAQAGWISSDWVNFFRKRLERRFGGIAIEMAGSVGSVETPEVFSGRLSRTPREFVNESHPAGCRTVFDAPAGQAPAPLGYRGETRLLGLALADSVGRALDRHPHPSHTDKVWGASTHVCVEVQNALFQIGGLAGVFSARPGYESDCTVAVPPLPNGTTTATEIQTDVAAYRIGAGEFITTPGESFPFTLLRSSLGPNDLHNPSPALSPWPLPHMHAPFRFVEGLGEDMIGYIFPAGNAVGIPSPSNLDPSSTDRFGCGHSDDSESASAQAGNLVGQALIGLLDSRGRPSERVVRGRYLLGAGAGLSRDPLGGRVIKCTGATSFDSRGRAVAVWIPGKGRVRPSAWMSSHGTRQARPTRDTRGWFTGRGKRRWLEVYAPLPKHG